jgi:hypothetical protein
MKQYIAKTVAAAALIIFIFAIDSSAQSSSRLVATIPFDFYVGTELLPRGTYEFKPATKSAYPSALIISPIVKTSGRPMFVPTLPNGSAKEGNAPAITFNRYGSDHYLSRIDCEPGLLAVRLRKTSVEKELAQEYIRPYPVVIRLANVTGH